MAAIDDSVLNSRDLATLDKTTHRLPTLTEAALVSGQLLVNTTALAAVNTTATTAATNATSALAGVTTASTAATNAAASASAAASSASTANTAVSTLTGNVPTMAKDAAIAIGELPIIRYTGTWPARATWISSNYPGYAGSVRWDSSRYTSAFAAQPAGMVNGDSWVERMP